MPNIYEYLFDYLQKTVNFVVSIIKKLKKMYNKPGLFRSTTDKVIGGVAGGIAKYFNSDPTIFRILFLLAAFFGGGGVLIYLILWIALPEDYSQNIYEQNFSPTDEKDNVVQQDSQSNFKSDPPKYTPDFQQKGFDNGSLIAGLILIGIGGIFLIVNYIPRIYFADLWPLILVIAGIALISINFSQKKQ